MIRRVTKVQLALFAAITLVGVSILSASYVGLTERVLGFGPTVQAEFDQSGGIFVGSEVTYRGVPVGRVTALTLLPDGVRVSARLDRGTRIPADTRVVVENRSAVGEQYLDFQPRRQGGRVLADGDVIGRADTAYPLRVDQLLLDVDHTVRSVDRDNLRTVVDELGTAFAGSGPDLGRLVDDGDLLTRSALDALPETVELLRNGRTVLDTQRDTSGQITTFARNLSRIATTLKTSDPDLRVVLDRGTVATAELDALIRDNRADLSTLAANLVTVGRVTTARVDGIDQLLITYPEVVAGGYTVVPGDGTAHFGVQLNTTPPPCTRGYGGTTRTDPNRTTGLPPLNTTARCTLPRGSASTVRGAQNAPRPGSSGSSSRLLALGGSAVPFGATVPGGASTAVAAPLPPDDAPDSWSWILTEDTR